MELTWSTVNDYARRSVCPPAFALELLFGWPQVGKGGRWFPTWGELMSGVPSAECRFVDYVPAMMGNAACPARTLWIPASMLSLWSNCTLTRCSDAQSTSSHSGSTGYNYYISPPTDHHPLRIILPTRIPDGVYTVIGCPDTLILDDRIVICKPFEAPNFDFR